MIWYVMFENDIVLNNKKKIYLKMLDGNKYK